MYEQAHIIIPLGFLMVLVADLISNLFTFHSRLINAITTGIIWCVLFLAVHYYTLAYPFTVDFVPGFNLEIAGLVPGPYVGMVSLIGIVFAFVADFIGNHLAFSQRIINSFVTATVWSVLMFLFLFFSPVA